MLTITSSNIALCVAGDPRRRLVQQKPDSSPHEQHSPRPAGQPDLAVPDSGVAGGVTPGPGKQLDDAPSSARRLPDRLKWPVGRTCRTVCTVRSLPAGVQVCRCARCSAATRTVFLTGVRLPKTAGLRTKCGELICWTTCHLQVWTICKVQTEMIDDYLRTLTNLMDHIFVSEYSSRECQFLSERENLKLM